MFHTSLPIICGVLVLCQVGSPLAHSRNCHYGIRERFATMTGNAPRQEGMALLARAEMAIRDRSSLFRESSGERDDGKTFVLSRREVSVHFSVDGLAFVQSFPERTVRVIFEGGCRVEPEGERASPTCVSYFEGARDRWRTEKFNYEEIVYKELWPGIDLTFRAKGSQLKYEFAVAPGADPSAIRLRVDGAKGLALVDGALEIYTPAGTLRDKPPISFQERDGVTAEIDTAYELDVDTSTIGFRVGEYDRTRPLIIDPEIILYSGFLGGSSTEYALDVAVDASGNVYVAGGTFSSHTDGFPVATGPDLTFNPTGRVARPPSCDTQDAFLDAFVAKLRADGSGFEYIGYIGGSCNQVASSIAVGSDGSAYVTGFTTSDQRSFPLRGGPRLTYGGGGYTGDAFVAKISPDGTQLVYAGYIGGSGDDAGTSIAVDAAGNAYVAGSTESPNFPVLGGPQRTLGSTTGDGFVTKVKADGSGLAYSGFVGGAREDRATGIALDAAGSAYVTGFTYSSTGLPVTEGPSLVYAGEGDAFVGKVKADGTGYTYFGYIGGTEFDAGTAIAVDAAGSACVVGGTSSSQSSFPVRGGPDLTFNDANTMTVSDAFVAKVSPDGSGLVFAGYIGGAALESASGVALAPDGSVVVVGNTLSREDSFPVVDAFDPTFGGGAEEADGFVARVAADGSSLLVSSFVGGAADDAIMSVAVDAAGGVYVVGYAVSTEASFPVVRGPALTHSGLLDAFVMKLSSGPAGPVVTSATKVGKKLVVRGENFGERAVILVNNAPYKTKADRAMPDKVLRSGKAGKIVVAGDVVKVRNANGTESNGVTFPRE